jgi:predicted PurR-regulated permease PerM
VNNSWRVDRVAPALAWIGLALLVYLVFLVVQPFLNPLGWASVITIVFYPVHARLEERWGPSRAAAVSTIAVAIIVIGPLLLVMAAFVQEAVDAAGSIQRAFADGRVASLDRMWRSVLGFVPRGQRVQAETIVVDAARQAAVFLASQSPSLLKNTAGFLFDLVIALFATFFLLRDSHAIVDVIRRVLPMEESARERLLSQIRALVSVSVTSAAIVAGVQGLLGGLVFAAVGIEAPVFWGVVMAFCCLLPLGAWVVWLPAAIYLWANGAVVRAIIVVALGLGIVSAVDNVLRPVLLSERTSLNGLLIFVALLGGLGAFGALGLVLGPILVALLLALLKSYVDSSERSTPLARRPTEVSKGA